MNTWKFCKSSIQPISRCKKNRSWIETSSIMEPKLIFSHVIFVENPKLGREKKTAQTTIMMIISKKSIQNIQTHAWCSMLRPIKNSCCHKKNYLVSLKSEEVSSRNWWSLCGGTKNTCVVASFAEIVSLSLLDPACLGRNPTTPIHVIIRPPKSKWSSQ